MALLHPLKLLTQQKLSLFAHSSPSRSHVMKALKSWEGIKYPGFTYYPRPGEKDPPYEPTKLLMVQRMRQWEKGTLQQRKILTSFGLGRLEFNSKKVILKNTTDINARLWQVKGLVRIVPVTTPDGLPSEENYSACHLDDDGVLRIKPELKVDEARLSAFVQNHNSPKKVKTDIWKKAARLKWVSNWDPLG